MKHVPPDPDMSTTTPFTRFLYSFFTGSASRPPRATTYPSENHSLLLRSMLSSFSRTEDPVDSIFLRIDLNSGDAASSTRPFRIQRYISSYSASRSAKESPYAASETNSVSAFFR